MAGMMPFSDKQIVELFNHFKSLKNSELYLCLISVLLNTGARISEVLSLRRRDLITKDGAIVNEIKIIKLKQKGGEKAFRLLPLQSKFKKHIENYLIYQQQKGFEQPYDLVFAINLKPLHRLEVFKKLNSVYKILAFKNHHGTHAFRKTFAKNIFEFYKNSYPDDAVKQLRLTQLALGHAKIDTTLKYLQFLDKGVNDAVKNIYSDLEV